MTFFWARYHRLRMKLHVVLMFEEQLHSNPQHLRSEAYDYLLNRGGS